MSRQAGTSAPGWPAVLVLLTAGLGVFITALDQTVVVTALRLTGSLRAPAPESTTAGD